MAILVAAISAIVTGMLVALVAYALGVYQQDLLVAIGIIGGGTQLGGLIAWYLLIYAPKRTMLARKTSSGDPTTYPHPLGRGGNDWPEI